MAAPAFSVPNQHAARLADPALRESLIKYARRRLPPGEVEDLVQNTLTDALVSANAPSTDGEFQRWVRGIARHKIADSYRRRGRQPLLDDELDAKPSEANAGAGELEQWIESELPKTEGASRTLHWLLRESEGESLDDIARDAALPAPRVRQRVSRLRRHFHARWLALGAAGLALLLAAGAVFHFAGKVAPVPPTIARELPTPLDRARALREHALERCAVGAYQECVAGLDAAKMLDPNGDSASAIRDARSAAARISVPAPEPSVHAPELSPKSSSVPKLAPKHLEAPAPNRQKAPSKMAPSKVAPNNVTSSKPKPGVNDAKDLEIDLDSGAKSAPTPKKKASKELYEYPAPRK